VGPFSNDQLGLNRETVSWHAGSAGTFYAQVILLHQSCMGFVVVTNSGTGEKTVGTVPAALMKWFVHGQSDVPAEQRDPSRQDAPADY
jgi:hypothetical protein